MKNYLTSSYLALSLLTACNMGLSYGLGEGEKKLQTAIEKDDVNEVRAILASGNVDINADSLLVKAVTKGDLSIVKALLDSKGLDLNSRDREGRTALIQAAYGNKHEIACALLENEATDPSLEDNSNYGGDRTALMTAVVCRHPEFVKTLLKDQRLNINQRNRSNGNTALIYAVYSNDESLVELLLEAGADPKVKNNENKTALMIAQEKGYQGMVELLRSTPSVAPKVSPHTETQVQQAPASRANQRAGQHLGFDLATVSTSSFQDIYNEMLLTGLSKGDAHLYAKTFMEQIEAEKSETWARVYTTQMVQGNTPEGARLYADAFEEQLKAGKSLSEANQIIKGESSDGGKTYTDSKVSSHSETQAQQAPASMANQRAGQHLGLDLATVSISSFQDIYNEMLLTGLSKGDAHLYAKTFMEQLEAGKSEIWARVYATQMVQGKSPEYAKIYTEAFEEQTKAGNSPIEAHQIIQGKIFDGVKTYMDGKLKEDAMLAAKEAGHSPEYCQKYGETYEQQRHAGKPHDWASAYSSQIARNKSETYATLFAYKRITGKSSNWSSMYAAACEDGKTDSFATKLADIYEEQLKLGQDKRWAKAYAMMIVTGNSVQEAREFANKINMKKKKG